MTQLFHCVRHCWPFLNEVKVTKWPPALVKWALNPRATASHMSDPENKGSTTRGVNFDTLGSWNNRLSLPILYEQSVKKGKLIPRVPVEQIGVSSVLGRRQVNEDRWVVEELTAELLYFGIFDGHGGSYAAQFVSDHLADHLSFWMSQTDDLMTVFKNSFCDLHNLLARHLVFYYIDDDTFKTGTTATVCLLRNSSELVVAHVGDSLAVLCRDGKPIRLSIDHDPEDVDESSRILKKGGRIIHNSQGVAHVNGRLAMTRSLGDVELKSYGVTALPYLRSIEVKHGSDAFLILSSDGLSFALSDEEMVNIVSSCQSPQEACSRLSDQAQHFGSEDNVTVLVIPLGAWGKYQKLTGGHNFNFGRILSNSRIY
ncbi:protein phosphatase 1K, mitochondrial-like [Physella acuta]|uniref:protein phosphatase 1K, mitochondrial-like n=1 Tax=Physella acuta TaxID=109671 RepID=UPI0027DC3B96|nr:protein phosphatase 1K, mitochondrial-like [Physella acuta]XP_059144558.1 protein phosphatase 1K, mitochondrial-like [Physella acuta]XP_059144559.1 protein phosphatase 1K, mitochondrial-like [Physella acuta]XP_059144560.1 protein phosphatase 1K, mitochondrial-like [Physella acuta]XP_059144561.1 protein phosphatase 1K, mitochondrial-like [Physella acuta]